MFSLSMYYFIQLNREIVSMSDSRGCSCGQSTKQIFHVLRSPMQLPWFIQLNEESFLCLCT